jgi:hypothetical protein
MAVEGKYQIVSNIEGIENHGFAFMSGNWEHWKFGL